MNITVYLGAHGGNDPALKEAVGKLGTWIGESGNCLVYGGSKTGLMGVLAESAVSSGGRVTGVEPAFFVERGMQYEALTELIVVRDMSERKAKMAELGDAFVALPGGTGTLEEISQIMSEISLGFLSAPCIIYNHKGYYNGLKQLLEKMKEQGLSTEERQRGIIFADSVDGIIRILEQSSERRGRTGEQE
ncbi:MAG: TIGR00730 family Rossman fold protein [Clostridium sp.]|nr:TIGR00730 family Rossman fold protein [Clostridium sp.]